MDWMLLAAVGVGAWLLFGRKDKEQPKGELPKEIPPTPKDEPPPPPPYGGTCYDAGMDEATKEHISALLADPSITKTDMTAMADHYASMGYYNAAGCLRSEAKHRLEEPPGPYEHYDQPPPGIGPCCDANMPSSMCAQVAELMFNKGYNREQLLTVAEHLSAQGYSKAVGCLQAEALERPEGAPHYTTPDDDEPEWVPDTDDDDSSPVDYSNLFGVGDEDLADWLNNL